MYCADFSGNNCNFTTRHFLPRFSLFFVLLSISILFAGIQQKSLVRLESFEERWKSDRSRYDNSPPGNFAEQNKIHKGWFPPFIWVLHARHIVLKFKNCSILAKLTRPEIASRNCVPRVLPETA